MSAGGTQLRDALVGRLAGRDAVRAWPLLADAGVLGLRIPETSGGLGLTVADAEPIFEALGELCLPVPYLETALVAAGLLARSTGALAEALLSRIANGERVAVAGVEPMLVAEVGVSPIGGGFALSGTARIVIGAMDADALLLVADHSLWVVDDAWKSARRMVPTIDGQIAADIDLDGITARRITDDAADIVDVVYDEAAAAICIEAAALMRRLVRDTTDYARHREQFGQPIGSFQVVQHRLVDMNIQARRATAIARRAVAMLESDPAERARAVSAAKVTIARAGRFVGQNAVQLHGGMGMTEELAIGRMFKRLTVIEAQFGSADDHLCRFRSARLMT